MDLGFYASQWQRQKLSRLQDLLGWRAEPQRHQSAPGDLFGHLGDLTPADPLPAAVLRTRAKRENRGFWAQALSAAPALGPGRKENNYWALLCGKNMLCRLLILIPTPVLWEGFCHPNCPDEERGLRLVTCPLHIWAPSPGPVSPLPSCVLLGPGVFTD